MRLVSPDGNAVERTDWSQTASSGPLRPLAEQLSEWHATTLAIRDEALVTLTVGELRKLLAFALDTNFALRRLRGEFEHERERTDKGATVKTLAEIAEIELRGALRELVDALDSRSPIGSGAGAEESWERIDAATERARELLERS